MRKKFTLLFLVFLAAPGCAVVDYAVDPIGCENGTHEPIFPWYPIYLLDPPHSVSDSCVSE